GPRRLWCSLGIDGEHLSARFARFYIQQAVLLFLYPSLLNTKAHTPLTQAVQTYAKGPRLPACAREPELRLESSSFPAGIQLPSGHSRWDYRRNPRSTSPQVALWDAARQ